MVLSAASCATPLSKHSVYPWEAHGSSLAETRILTEKTSPSVSERAAQRIRDRNRRLVHLCIWKKAQRGKGSACPGHGRRAGERGQPSPHCGCRGSAGRRAGGTGGKVPWGGAVCPWRSGAGRTAGSQCMAAAPPRSRRALWSPEPPTASPRLPRAMPPRHRRSRQGRNHGNPIRATWKHDAGSCHPPCPVPAASGDEGAGRGRASLVTCQTLRHTCLQSRLWGQWGLQAALLCSLQLPAGHSQPLESLWLAPGAPASVRGAAKSPYFLQLRIWDSASSRVRYKSRGCSSLQWLD